MPELRIDPLTGANQKAVADHVEHRQAEQRKGQRQRHEQQGQLAPGRDHAVVDLEHVEGRREVQQVDQQAEARCRHEVLLALAQSAGDHRRDLDSSDFHYARVTARQQ